MKVLLLGATGPTGHFALKKLLDLGDEVTVLVRTPDKLKALKSKVHIVNGDVRNLDDVERAVKGQEAIVAALGRGKSTKADNLFTDAAKTVCQAADKNGVKRLVWLSSFGVGDTINDATSFQRFMYKTMLKNIYTNKAASELIIRQSDLDWTLVYPSALMNGEATGKYKAAEHIKMQGAPRINRADVGEFLATEAHDNHWICRNVELTSK